MKAVFQKSTASRRKRSFSFLCFFLPRLPHLPPASSLSAKSIVIFGFLPYTVFTGVVAPSTEERRSRLIEVLKAEILESIRQTGSYHYSLDLSKKAAERSAVDELEADGLITSVTKAIGYVNAEAL